MTWQSFLRKGIGRTLIWKSRLVKVNQPNVINTIKTCYLSNGRPSVMLRCNNDIQVEENCVGMTNMANVRSELGKNIFQKTIATNNEKIGLFIDYCGLIDYAIKRFLIRLGSSLTLQ